MAAIDEDAEADAAAGGVMGIAVLRARVRRFGEQPSRGGSSRALRERVEKAVVVCREQRSRARERQIGRSILKEGDGDVIAARSNLLLAPDTAPRSALFLDRDADVCARAQRKHEHRSFTHQRTRRTWNTHV